MTQVPWKGPHANPPRATPEDFARAARLIGCSPAEIRAVWKVEAAGRPFRADGSVERRFEPHHFPKRLWSRIGFTVRPNEAPWRASLRQSGNTMLEKAYAVDEDGMLTASSWGAPQIMGFNAGDAGHITARNMVVAMSKAEAAHLDAFVALINKWGLAPAIRAHDWERFARRYNGPGQVQHYATLLERAFNVTSVQKHAAALETASREETGVASYKVLRLGDDNATVAKLQRALGVEDDGVFGILTEKAVREYQTENGLVSDGVVGARTWRSLEAGGRLTEKVDTQPTSAAPKGSAAGVAVPAATAAGAALAVNPMLGAVVIGAVVLVVGGVIWWRSRR